MQHNNALKPIRFRYAPAVGLAIRYVPVRSFTQEEYKDAENNQLYWKIYVDPGTRQYVVRGRSRWKENSMPHLKRSTRRPLRSRPIENSRSSIF